MFKLLMELQLKPSSFEVVLVLIKIYGLLPEYLRWKLYYV